jgi:O-antigen/teichoic acid export membrane protein
MGRNYSLEELGLFSFASRIAMILAIVETSIRLSWRPMLYENLKKANFGASYFKISKLVGSLLLVTGTVIIGLSTEIIYLIGTPEYYPSRLMIGGILIAQIIQNLDSLRGFGFEVAKKTYIISIITIVSRALGIVFLIFAAKPFGLLGVAIAYMVPLLLSYPIKVLYTKRFISVNTSNIREVGLWALLVIAYGMTIYSLPLHVRSIVILASVILAFPFHQARMYAHNWNLLKQTRKNEN